MAVMEVVIFVEGFSLLKRNYQDIRYIEDDDMVSSLVYANLLNIEARLDSNSEFFKMDTEKYVMHLAKRRISDGTRQNSKNLVIYMMENANINEKKSKRLLNKILDMFLAKYVSEIDDLMKNPRRLEDLENNIDKMMKKLK
ncbi:MAG: hypothetical protein ACFFCS_28320 [Candidatus Hodarchaeota archaeon]